MTNTQETQEKPETKQNTLVVGPFLGELGWEMFSWQPYIRGLFLQSNADRCVVYGGPGRSSLYDFAEYREIDLPKGNSECNLMNNFQEIKAELNSLGQQLVDIHQKEEGDFQFFWINNLKTFNDPMYMLGKPNLIRARTPYEYNDKNVCLCVRDREMSSFRNWDYENWYGLAESLVDICNVYVVGKVNDTENWKMPEEVTDLTNQTTIDDCVNVFSGMKLMVGGSTGLLHLASRMGKDHFVWGVKKNVLRYAETNWFGANYDVYTEKAWFPEPNTIYNKVKSYLEKGDFT